MKFGFFVARHIKLQFHSGSTFIFKRTKTYSQWVKKRKNNMDLLASRENPIIMKLDTPEFHSIFTDELKCLAELFKKYNYDIRVAGGAVRDILMKITPKDLDFATTATPEQMKEMFTKEEIRMINDKGEKHGTITARINDKENFEVTTLRIDMVTDGRHAEVAFTTDWKLDANRRDLTINSMFLDFEGNIYDYFFGYEDLNNRRIAFVGDPATRIQEDYLRILRYFRFYGRIASEPDNHDESTIKAIKENVNGLERISGERIWVELNKILEGNYSRELVNKIVECGLSKYIGLPEKSDIENFNQVLLQTRKNEFELKPCSKLASLVKNEEEALKFHNRMKLSAYNRDLMLFIAANKNNKNFKNDIKPLQYILLHEKGKKEVKKEYIIQMLKYMGNLDTLREFESWNLPSFPVGGNAVKSYVTNAKMIGAVIERLKDIWLESEFKLTKDELIELIPRVVEDIDESVVKKLNVRNK